MADTIPGLKNPDLYETEETIPTYITAVESTARENFNPKVVPVDLPKNDRSTSNGDIKKRDNNQNLNESVIDVARKENKLQVKTVRLNLNILNIIGIL